jgi:large subunit ribosomal protein L30
MPRTFVWHPGRGPAKTEKAISDAAKTVEIRQVRSGIGHSWRMRQTLEAIGLKHHQDVIVVPYTPSLAGQLKRVRHLVSVKKHD